MNGWHETALETPDGLRITAAIREGPGPALVLIPGTWGNADTAITESTTGVGQGEMQ